MSASVLTGKADIHLHSSYSDGVMTIPELLDWVEEKTDLDVIAITDHDELAGALEARERVARGHYRFDVIVGMEVSTREGHLLALFLERPVRTARPLVETIAEVQAQGGICVVPHPLSWLTTSVGARALERALAQRLSGLVGIEVANPTLAGQVTRRKVARLNRLQYGLAETGGSDAHFLQSVGTAFTRFPGRTAADLRQALLERATVGVQQEGKRAPVTVRDLLHQQSRSLIWLPAKRMRQRMRERRALA